MKLGMKGGDVPEQYVAAIATMAAAVRDWVRAHPKAKPEFRMADREVMVGALLEELAPRVCKNADAREICRVMESACLRSMGAQPSIFMADIVLQHEELPIERVSLDALGLRVLHDGTG